MAAINVSVLPTLKTVASLATIPSKKFGRDLLPYKNRILSSGPSSSSSMPTNLRPIDPRQSYENNDTLRRVRHSKDNVPLESIKLTSVIGEGEFGSVYKG